LPLCSSYFPFGVSQLPGHNHHQLHASHHWHVGNPLVKLYFSFHAVYLFFYCVIFYIWIRGLQFYTICGVPVCTWWWRRTNGNILFLHA
jgi:hypothetical protein